MWESIELRELRAFLAVADELHFGRAATRLHMTQSAVSQSIRALERKLGAPLFHRTSRTVALTAAGERLLADLAPAHEGLGDVLRRASRAAEDVSGVLRLGLLSPTAGGPHLVELVERYEHAHPGAQVAVVEIPMIDPFSPLQRFEVDVMAARLPLLGGPPDLDVGALLSEEPRVLAVARTHPLAERTTVDLEDVSHYPVAPLAGVPDDAVDMFIPREAPSGRPIRRLEARPRSVTELMTLVARGTIVHPTVPSVAEYYGHPGVTYIGMPTLPSSRSALVWLRDRLDARIRALDSLVAEVRGHRHDSAGDA